MGGGTGPESVGEGVETLGVVAGGVLGARVLAAGVGVGGLVVAAACTCIATHTQAQLRQCGLQLSAPPCFTIGIQQLFCDQT